MYSTSVIQYVFLMIDNMSLLQEGEDRGLIRIWVCEGLTTARLRPMSQTFAFH